MNSSMHNNRNSFNNSFNNLSKINPFNGRKSTHILNNITARRKFLISNSNREFGKEINISSNLIIANNQDAYNNRKTFRIPIEQKIKNMKKEKQELNNKLKNQGQIVALRKKKKCLSNSLLDKPKSSNGKFHFNKSSIIQLKKGNNKYKYKNQSQKNIFNENKKINIKEDVVIINENINPNIINNKNILNKKDEEDIEMKIENNNDIKFSNCMNIVEPLKISNPQNVDEYFDDICDEYSKNEEKYLVDPQYMSNQNDINFRMRAILIDWLIDVHLKYKLLPQTMYIAVNLIDRYLEKNDTNRAKLQLAGITAMFIACKYEEIYSPELKDFVYITDGAYVKSDVLKMEKKMLTSLNYDITFPTQWSLLETYKRKLALDEKTFKLAWFLMELCLINYKTLKFKMSYIAASSILIASKTLGVYKNDWLYKNIGVEEKSLEECCKEIYDFYIYNANHNLQAIRKKFSSSKFNEVAKIKIC